MKDVLVKRNVVIDVLCPLCKGDRESAIHLLARCPFAQIMRRPLSPLGINMNTVQGDSVLGWWDNLLERWKGMKEHKETWAAVGSIIWQIWKCQNDAVFNNKLWQPDQTCTAAIRDALDFLKVNEGILRTASAGQVATVRDQVRRQKPMDGWVKINFDGGLDSLSKTSGLGDVIRDSSGRFRVARPVHFGYLMNPLVLEAMAAWEGLIFAKELGLQKVHVEGDSQVVVNMMQKQRDSNSSVGVLFADMDRLRWDFEGTRVSFV